MSAKSLCLMTLALIVGLSASTTFVQAYVQSTWLGSVDQDWMNDANWSAGAPDVSDGVTAEWADIASDTSGGPILDNASVDVAWCKVSGTGALVVGPNATLNVNSIGDLDVGFGGTPIVDNYGAITTTNRLQVGRAGGTATFNMYGGSVTAGGDIKIGREGGSIGVLNMYDGTITSSSNLSIGEESGHTGVLNLYGGTVTATDVLIYDPTPPKMILIGNGVLLLVGDKTSRVDGYVGGDERIRPMNPTALIMRDYNITNPGYTTVWADIPADFNDDGVIDDLDLTILATHWQMSGGHGEGDANDDGFVDDLDLTALATEWPAGDLDASAVPEPATLSLLALGGLAMLRKRR